MSSRDFAYSTEPEPHRGRTKEILKQHPEVRKLIGKNPMTFWYALGIVVFQIALAVLLRNQPWWLIVLVAYFVGAFANHALFVVIHECAHRLVFEKRLPNVLTGMLADLPMVIPGSVQFAKFHLKHHAFQGIYELDSDLPYHWEARLIGSSWWRKVLWLLFFPIVEGLRPTRTRKEINFWDLIFASSLIVQFGFDIAVVVLLGPMALLYLALSLFFGIGLHPLGARWIQRHYLMDGGTQETFSYYGPLNRLAFNVGYHNEHHDFPSIPWNRLPTLRRTAPEVYDGLVHHDSWTKLLFRFLFDSNVSLYSRIVRRERGGVGLDDSVRPDMDVVKGRGSRVV